MKGDNHKKTDFRRHKIKKTLIWVEKALIILQIREIEMVQ